MIGDTMAAKEKFDSMWDEKKDAESVANKYRRFWISTSVQPRDSAPGWVVYINTDHVESTRKKVRGAAQQIFPGARSLTVIFRHGCVYLQVDTMKVYRVARTKVSEVSATGFRFDEE